MQRNSDESAKFVISMNLYLTQLSWIVFFPNNYSFKEIKKLLNVKEIFFENGG